MPKKRYVTKHYCRVKTAGHYTVMTSTRTEPLLCPLCGHVWIVKDPALSDRSPSARRCLADFPFEEWTAEERVQSRLEYLDFLRRWLPRLTGEDLERQITLIMFVSNHLFAEEELHLDDAFPR